MATAVDIVTQALGFAPPAGVVPLTPEQLERYKELRWGAWVQETASLSAQKRQERLMNAYKSVGIPKHFRGNSLDTFSAICDNDIDKALSLSKVRKYVRDKHLDGKVSLVFWNVSRGVGKTGLATAVFSELLNAQGADMSGLWLDYQELLDVIRQGFRPNAVVDPYELQMKAARTPLLLLDNFGSNVRLEVSEAVVEITAKIINYRHREELPTLITTNLSRQEVQSQLGEDTYQRLVDMAAWIKVEGRILRNLA